MCLFIHRLHYLDYDSPEWVGEFKGYVGLKADSDIFVRKVLISNPSRNTITVNDSANNYLFCTPYQGTEIVFDEEGECFLDAQVDFSRRMVATVNQGIHAFRAFSPNEVRFVTTPEECANFNYIDTPAIIPKGTYFFFGCDYDDDIVAEKMLLFEDMESYERYCEKNGESIGSETLFKQSLKDNVKKLVNDKHYYYSECLPF